MFWSSYHFYFIFSNQRLFFRFIFPPQRTRCDCTQLLEQQLYLLTFSLTTSTASTSTASSHLSLGIKSSPPQQENPRETAQSSKSHSILKPDPAPAQSFLMFLRCSTAGWLRIGTSNEGRELWWHRILYEGETLCGPLAPSWDRGACVNVLSLQYTMWPAGSLTRGVGGRSAQQQVSNRSIPTVPRWA